MMKATIFVGEIRTGHGAYSQRTDDFNGMLEQKLSQIYKLAETHEASVFLSSGIKERNSDLSSIPVMMRNFFKAETFAAKPIRRSSFFDILEASKCISAPAQQINVVYAPEELPPRLIAGRAKGWFVFLGSTDALMPMAELIEDAYSAGKLLGIFASKGETACEIPGVYAIPSLIRSNEESEKPYVWLATNGVVTKHEIEINENVFYYERAAHETDGDYARTESDFVRRLKEETSLLHDSDEMDSEKNLRRMMEDTFRTVVVSEPGRAIIENLFSQTK